VTDYRGGSLFTLDRTLRLMGESTLGTQGISLGSPQFTHSRIYFQEDTPANKLYVAEQTAADVLTLPMRVDSIQVLDAYRLAGFAYENAEYVTLFDVTDLHSPFEVFNQHVPDRKPGSGFLLLTKELFVVPVETKVGTVTRYAAYVHAFNGLSREIAHGHEVTWALCVEGKLYTQSQDTLIITDIKTMKTEGVISL
jgi:hypothetical protein